MKKRIVDNYINEIKRRDVLENQILNYLVTNGSNYELLNNLLEYLITQLMQQNEISNKIDYDNNMNQASTSSYNQIHGNMESICQVKPPQVIETPSYIFENFKNIRHIKIAFHINNIITKETGQNPVQLFQQSKKDLIN